VGLLQHIQIQDSVAGVVMMPLFLGLLYTAALLEVLRVPQQVTLCMAVVAGPETITVVLSIVLELPDTVAVVEPEMAGLVRHQAEGALQGIALIQGLALMVNALFME
jgi:hypothetical protein